MSERKLGRPELVCTLTQGRPDKRRWDFRVEPDTDRLVREAAEAAHRTRTDFVVDGAVLEAERLLADRTQFVLDSDAVGPVRRGPRSPAARQPGAQKLFAKPSVFSAE